jgi:hypothetical protein
VPPAPAPPAGERPAGELRGLWERLGTDDAAAAFDAMGKLAETPGPTTSFLNEQLAALAPGPEAGPDLRRGLRAVEVLEQLRTADARRALERLAGQAPAGRIQEEARAAAGRMKGE